jgi:hypothetical protein
MPTSNIRHEHVPVEMQLRLAEDPPSARPTPATVARPAYLDLD